MKNYNFDAAQDWSKYFKLVFDTIKVDKLLEFGLGNGTEFLLDNCGKVVSLEISLGDYNKSWHDMCLDKYKDYKNWESIYVDAPKEVVKSNEIAQSKRYPIDYDLHIEPLKK